MEYHALALGQNDAGSRRGSGADRGTTEDPVPLVGGFNNNNSISIKFEKQASIDSAARSRTNSEDDYVVMFIPGTSGGK